MAKLREEAQDEWKDKPTQNPQTQPSSPAQTSYTANSSAQKNKEPKIYKKKYPNFTPINLDQSEAIVDYEHTKNPYPF